MQKIKKLWLEKKGQAIIIMRLSDTVDRRHMKWAYMEMRQGSDILVLHPDDFRFYNPNGRQNIEVLKKRIFLCTWFYLWHQYF